MKKTSKLLVAFFLLFCFISLLSFQVFSSEVFRNIDVRRIQEHIRFFSSISSRVTGYPGADEAAQYIRENFRKSGLRDVMIQDFEVLVPVSYRAEILLNNTGESIQIYPMWPNSVRTPALPEEGLRGDLVYVGYGGPEDLDGLRIKGNIALMEFNSGYNWVQVANLGATAIIFIEPKEATRNEAEQKFLSTPAHIPRFWLTRERAEWLMRTQVGLSMVEEASKSGAKDPSRLAFLMGEGKAVPVTLYSDVRWEKRVGKNIIGYVEGTDPELKGELVILQANYDSMSIVPDIAPGAEQAVGISTMLEVAYAFELSPPKRSVLFLATAGHGQAMAGMRAFVDHQLAIEEGRIDAEHPLDYLNRRIRDTFLLSFDLTSTSRMSTIFFAGHMYGLNLGGKGSQFSAINNVFNTLAKKVANDLRVLERDYYIDSISGAVESGRTSGPGQGGEMGGATEEEEKAPWDQNMGSQVPLSSEIFTLGGGTGFTFITPFDPRTYIDTPHDIGARVDIRNVQLQARFLASFIWEFLSMTPQEGYPEPAKLSKSFYHLTGEVSTVNPKPGLQSMVPVESAIVVVRQGFRTRVGVRGDILVLTDGQGRFHVPGVISSSTAPGMRAAVEGYLLDAGSGSIIYATNLSSEGMKGAQLLSISMDRLMKDINLTLFPARSMLLFDIIDEKLAAYGRDVSVQAYDAHGLYVIPEFGYSVPYAPIVERAFPVFLPPDAEVKLAFGPPAGKPLTLLTNADSEEPEGHGLKAMTDVTIPVTLLQVVNDAWWMNESRLQTMRANGVEQNHRIRQQHSTARAYINRAISQLETLEYAGAAESLENARSLVIEVYPLMRDTVVDIVKGFLFYLAILFPFTFIAERLIFNFNEFNKRAFGVVIIFMIVVVTLKFVHPAFTLTYNPWILILGFLVGILFILTFLTIFHGFAKAISKKRRRPGSLRNVDINRSAAFAMAFSLGVVNMRKRRLRTGLTCVTLILLMFLLMSFTSVLPYMSYIKSYIGNVASYDGFLIRESEFQGIPEAAFQLLATDIGSNHRVTPRSWYTPSRRIDIVANEETYQVKGLMGLTPEEIEVSPIKDTLIAGRWFDKSDIEEKPEYVRGAKRLLALRLREEFIRGRVAVISSELANTFGITSNDVGKATLTLNIPSEERDEFGKLQVRTFDFLVIGIFDTSKYAGIKDIDSSLVTPMDFQRVAGQGGSQPPEDTIIIPFEAALDMGGEIRSIAIRPADGTDYLTLLNKIIAAVPYPVYVARDGIIELYKPAGMLNLTRHVELVIPIILVCLIVLNVMMGAVYERGREIHIYTALGLSPAHIGGLFLAESCTYAILGGLSGYVIGQLLAKAVVHFGLLPGLSLNYSSMATIGPLALVMGVVITSSLYPASMAATRSAPTIERRWKRPTLGYGEAEFEMPFVLTRSESVAICGFLKEFFEAHENPDAGDFATRGIEVFKEVVEHGSMFVVKCDAHIAPYDLGINQTIEVRLVPEIGGTRYKVILYLKRLTGDVPSWQRTNYSFMGTIRRQFLVWRAVSPADKDEFESQGKRLLGESQEVEREVVKGEPVVSSDNSVIIRLLDNIVIRIRKEYDEIIGIDQVSFNELPLRNPTKPIRPVLESSDGVRYSGWRYVSFDRQGESVVIHTKIVGKKLPYVNRLDPLQRPLPADEEIVTEGEDKVFIDDLDVVFMPYRLDVDGDAYIGFGYQYHFIASDKNRRIDTLYEISTWELGGMAEGKTLILPGYYNAPEFVVTPEASFTTECVELSDIFGRLLPRFGVLECFDFQYGEVGSMVMYYDEPRLIWSRVRKRGGSHCIEFHEKIQFRSASDVKTPIRYVLVSKERCDRTTGRNRWTQLHDIIYSRYREKTGISQGEAVLTLSRGLLTSGNDFERTVKSIPLVKEWGFTGLQLGPIWKSDFTEGCGIIRERGGSGNPFAIWDLEVASDLGGEKGLKELCTEATKEGIEVMAWVSPALSDLSPLFEKHPAWKLIHIDGWPYKANHLDITGINLNSDFVDYFYSRIQRLVKATGLSGLFIGRYLAFGVVPLHYTENEIVPQFEGIMRMFARLQGLVRLTCDGHSPFASPSYLDSRSLHYLKGFEFAGYNTAIQIDVESFKRGEIDVAEYYRLIANKVIPTLIWSGERPFDEVLPPEIKGINQVFQQVQNMMRIRRLLSDDRGVEWKNPDNGDSIIFAFKSFEYEVDITREVIDLTTGNKVDLDEYGRFQGQPMHIYRTVELFGGKGVQVKVRVSEDGIGLMKDVREVAVRIIDTIDDRSVVAVITYGEIGHLIQWLFKLGNKVEIIEPEDIRAQIRDFGETLTRTYHSKKTFEELG